jgi:hypothetical protein
MSCTQGIVEKSDLRKLDILKNKVDFVVVFGQKRENF